MRHTEVLSDTDEGPTCTRAGEEAGAEEARDEEARDKGMLIGRERTTEDDGDSRSYTTVELRRIRETET